MTQSTRRPTAIIPPTQTFEVKPWRDIMPKAQADAKNKLLKEAEKKAANNGITKPKHKATVLTSKTPPLAPASAFPDNPYRPGTVGLRVGHDQGVDSAPEGVIHSSDVAKQGDAFTQLAGALMNAPTESKASPAQAEKEAAAKAKIAEKAAKQEAAAKAKAEREAKAAAAAKEKAEKAEKAKAEKEAKEAEKAKAKEAREKARAERPPRDPNAIMSALGERTKAGIYVKGANGQMRSNDDLAIALESIPAAKMVSFLLQFMALPTNPYAALNYGQQSMNLRNKLRGMLKAGHRVVTPGTKAVAEKKEGDKVVVEAKAAVPPVTVPVTIELLKAARDEGNWTHDEAKAAKEAEAAKKAQAKEHEAASA